MGNICFWCILCSIGFVLLLSLFFPTANVFFHFSILKNYRKIKFESDYYRDILGYSPSEILYIYNKEYKNNKLSRYEKICKYQKLFYINILKMYLLGYVRIDFSNENNLKIIKNDVIILDKEYKMVYDYIFSIITKENEIWLNDINNYVEYNYNDEFFIKWNYFINNSLSMRGFYTTDFIRFQKDAIIKYYKIVIPILILITLYLLIILPSMGIMAIFVFPIFLIFGYLDSKNIKVQSNRSIYEYKKIMALKKFLKDFTIINERGPEYVEILEDYIVYAAIFDMYDMSLLDVMEEIRLYLKVNN